MIGSKMGAFNILYFSKFVTKELNTVTTVSLSTAESSILATDIDLQTIDSDIVSMEIFFKAWLHNSGTDREHVHLLLPSRSISNISRTRDDSSTLSLKDILHRQRLS